MPTPEIPTITIPKDEHECLMTIKAEIEKIQARGVQQFNRLSPEIRLALTTLQAFERDRR